MEVRALAGRSADMAQRISDLISASNRQVELGVAKVGATGEALGRIAQEVGRLNGIVEDIARGAADQARSLVEVNAAIRERDQTTQNNAALAEESHATTRRFAEEIAALDARLRPFRLDPAMAEREAA
jgi:methyl-accepting chemotaxis protein